MPIAKKRKSTSRTYSPAEVAAAEAAAATGSKRRSTTDWSSAVVSAGGGVGATILAVRRTRGLGKKPSKQQVAIRLDPDIIEAFKAGGPGWQTRMNAALKEWLSARPPKRKTRRPGVA